MRCTLPSDAFVLTSGGARGSVISLLKPEKYKKKVTHKTVKYSMWVRMGRGEGNERLFLMQTNLVKTCVFHLMIYWLEKKAEILVLVTALIANLHS